LSRYYFEKATMEWVSSGVTYFLTEPFSTSDKLPSVVYSIEWNEDKHRFELKKTQDSFTFDYKIYGLDKEFINRVGKTYEHTTANLGILLNGVRGTGKTVTAKQICNLLKMPVLIIHDDDDDLPSFINMIKQDVIIFIDEYEKIYKENSKGLLSLMDGVFDNGFRRVFLLTTNELCINRNLLQRPGRIRYKKEYKDMELDVIMEIIDDLLVNKDLKQAVLNFVSTLETITIDVLKSIIEEVNIHEEDPAKFGSFFNIRTNDIKYDVYKVADEKEVPHRRKVHINEMEDGFEDGDICDDVYAGGHYEGSIVEVFAKDDIMVEKNEVKTRLRFKPVEVKHESFDK
jgi:SpoVK/Ycf46/Vps4 family AAA+-type ATPase